MAMTHEEILRRENAALDLMLLKHERDYQKLKEALIKEHGLEYVEKLERGAVPPYAKGLNKELTL